MYQENSSQPGGDGHWFTIAVHLVDNEFQVIDSLRNSDNNELTLKANQVRAKVITLWNKFTSKHKGCQVPHIYKFTLRYVDGYKQFKM